MGKCFTKGSTLIENESFLVGLHSENRLQKYTKYFKPPNNFREFFFGRFKTFYYLCIRNAD